MTNFQFYIRNFLRRIYNFTVNSINFFSFGMIKFDSFSRLRLINNDSLDCISGLNSNSSDSDPEDFNNRPKLQLQLIANEAVAHSYEDITKPDYRNYLWLSSQWDRTDLFSAFYFLLNWSEHFVTKLESDEIIETNNFSILFKKRTCNSFFNFIDNLSFQVPDSFFTRRKSKKLKTLVLDLDETLIHSTSSSNCANFDFMVEVLVNRASCLYYVYKRPNLDYFLNVISNWYNLIIFTASVREYADPVIDLIDENGNYFKKRLFRTDCTQTPSSHYLKDLSLIDVDISKICLLDNSAASFAFYPDNAIPIESWKDDHKDSALLDILPFLDALRFVDDVRSILSLRRLLLFSNK